MAQAAVLAATLAISFFQQQQASAAADAQAQAAQQEADRVAKEEDRIAAENKSDRVTRADKEQASLVASLAEIGGGGTVNEMRFVQEVGFLEGLDVARIEDNRRSRIDRARHGASTVAINSQGEKTAARLRFGASAVSVAGKGLDAKNKLDAAGDS